MSDVFHIGASLVAQMIKNLPAIQETQVLSLGWEDPLEKKTAERRSSSGQSRGSRVAEPRGQSFSRWTRRLRCSCSSFMQRGDPSKPRGRTSSDAFSVQTRREEHKRKHPDSSVSFAEFCKKCSERWKTMSAKEKSKFEDTAKSDKDEKLCPSQR